jgi:hypothetical protein
MRLPASLGEFSISPEASRLFAEASGDFNPLHLDPTTARRYPFGRTIIHGVHGLLKTLDLLAAHRASPLCLESLKARFIKPVSQGERVEVTVRDCSDDSVALELLSQGRRVETLELGLASDPSAEQPAVTSEPQNLEPRELKPEEAADLTGQLELVWQADAFRALFPNLAEFASLAQCQSLMGTTQLVGMICPGLNSVFAGLSFDFQAGYRGHSTLDYRVKHIDTRFSRALIDVAGPAGQGEIEAFFRAAPVDQASAADIATLVDPATFHSCRALIVGGSRGAGEVLSKLLAAGGAEVLLTYNSGGADADRVRNEITAAGGRCSAEHYNVLEKNIPSAVLQPDKPFTHLFYFASPTIEKSETSEWNHDLFAKYCRFYVEGMANLLLALLRQPGMKAQSLSVFVPSTCFLDDPKKGFAEYIAAKAAAETVASQFTLLAPSWRVEMPRLPRMLTDQTSAVMSGSALDNARLLLQHLQRDQ